MLATGSFANNARDTLHAFTSRAASQQGGLLDGKDPTAYNPGDPIRIAIIQIVLIVLTSQLLHLGLKRIKQPKVISEILAGIILGPTAFGRIPHFTQHIFPANSLPFLNLLANLGLVLFLFLVGMEIDASTIKRNYRRSVVIAICAMALPFALGVSISKAIYPNFIPSSVKYTYYMLFNGVSYSITAFPVLARILIECKLLDTTVGVCVLSAGVCNDIVGWTLLALAVALVNASSGIEALYVILCVAAWALFILFPVRWGLLWFARRTRSTGGEPSFFFMTTVMMLVLASAFFTDIVGVHAIFGAFLVGLAVPREGGLAITLTEKLEDMVAVIFLPLYFTLSGLSTDLGLLNTGRAWGFTFALIFTDWFGKFTGGTTGARIAGFKLREAATVGTLMSCKGLVELVVLNIGLQAGILTPQVFAMFVLDALFLTFWTTPVVAILYPPHLRVHVSQGESDKKGVEGKIANLPGLAKTNHSILRTRTKLTVILDKFEHLPGLMSITQLIWPTSAEVASLSGVSSRSSTSSLKKKNSLNDMVQPVQPISIDALRIFELDDRGSTFMKSTRHDVLALSDQLLRVFKTHGEINGAHVTSELTVAHQEAFGRVAGEHAINKNSDMILVSWAPMLPNVDAQTHDQGAIVPASVDAAANAQSIRSIFKDSPVDVGLYIDQRSPSNDGGDLRKVQHVFLPFFGGADDRAALQFVVQLCRSEKVKATIVRVARGDDEPTSPADEKANESINHLSGYTLPAIAGDTVYAMPNTAHRLQSTLADDLLWEQCTASASSFLDSQILSRVSFSEVTASKLLSTAMERAIKLQSEGATGRLLVVLGRSRRMAAESFHTEMKSIMEKHNGVGMLGMIGLGGVTGHGSELRKTIGDPAMAALVLLGQSRAQADIMVIQASLDHDDSLESHGKISSA